MAPTIARATWWRDTAERRVELKPILIIAHLDVVEARREDWTTDPFQFVEKDGYFYGRGTQDMKVSDAIGLATLFIRRQRQDDVSIRAGNPRASTG